MSNSVLREGGPVTIGTLHDALPPQPPRQSPDTSNRVDRLKATGTTDAGNTQEADGLDWVRRPEVQKTLDDAVWWAEPAGYKRLDRNAVLGEEKFTSAFHFTSDLLGAQNSKTREYVWVSRYDHPKVFAVIEDSLRDAKADNPDSNFENPMEAALERGGYIDFDSFLARTYSESPDLWGYPWSRANVLGVWPAQDPASGESYAALFYREPEGTSVARIYFKQNDHPDLYRGLMEWLDLKRAGGDTYKEYGDLTDATKIE